MVRRLTSALGASGATPLLAGLLFQALSTYFFLVVAGRELGPTRFGALSGLYLLLTSAATGLFVPLEQEVTRRRGQARAQGHHDHELRRRSMRVGLLVSASACLLLLAAFPATLRVLGGQASMLLCLLVGLPGYACWFATRGDLAGAGRLGRYGAQLAIDGLSRILALLLLMPTDAGLAAYGAAFALSPWLTLVLTRVRIYPPAELPRSPEEPLARGVTLLIVSALCAQLVINAGPVFVNLLAGPAERATAGLYLAALVVLRVPVFLFTALQPGFLRGLSEQVGRADLPAYLRILRTMLAGVALVAAIATVVAATLGPPVISALFDFQERLPRQIYLLLTIAVGLFLVATVLAQALVAMGHHRAIPTGWSLGLIGVVLGLCVPGSAVERGTASLLGGSGAALVALAWLLRRSIRRWRLDGVVSGLPDRSADAGSPAGPGSLQRGRGRSEGRELR